MPTGIYKRIKPVSEETRRKLREAMLRIGHKPPGTKGLKMSKESCERIRQSKIGSHHTLEVRTKMSKARSGCGNHFYGRHHSAETREKMKLAKANFYKNGGKSPNYIEDRSKLVKRQQRNDSAYEDWRNQVRKRDGWKCQLADENCEGRVIAHHIKLWSEFPEFRYQVKNGITLCRFHHPRTRDGEKKLEPILQKIVEAKG